MRIDGVGEEDEVFQRILDAIDAIDQLDCRAPARSDPLVITRKSQDQIALMRRAGRVVAEMHERCTAGGQAGRHHR